MVTKKRAVAGAIHSLACSPASIQTLGDLGSVMICKAVIVMKVIMMMTVMMMIVRNLLHSAAPMLHYYHTIILSIPKISYKCPNYQMKETINIDLAITEEVPNNNN